MKKLLLPLLCLCLTVGPASADINITNIVLASGLSTSDSLLGVTNHTHTARATVQQVIDLAAQQITPGTNTLNQTTNLNYYWTTNVTVQVVTNLINNTTNLNYYWTTNVTFQVITNTLNSTTNLNYYWTTNVTVQNVTNLINNTTNLNNYWTTNVTVNYISNYFSTNSIWTNDVGAVYVPAFASPRWIFQTNSLYSGTHGNDTFNIGSPSIVNLGIRYLTSLGEPNSIGSYWGVDGSTFAWQMGSEASHVLIGSTNGQMKFDCYGSTNVGGPSSVFEMSGTSASVWFNSGGNHNASFYAADHIAPYEFKVADVDLVGAYTSANDPITNMMVWNYNGAASPIMSLGTNALLTVNGGVKNLGSGWCGTTNANAPSDAVTIKAWVNYTNSAGGVFKMPLYQ